MKKRYATETDCYLMSYTSGTYVRVAIGSETHSQKVFVSGNIHSNLCFSSYFLLQVIYVHLEYKCILKTIFCLVLCSLCADRR